jgi:hypothetical protein
MVIILSLHRAYGNGFGEADKFIELSSYSSEGGDIPQQAMATACPPLNYNNLRKNLNIQNGAG